VDRGGRHRAGSGQPKQHVGAGQRLVGRAPQAVPFRVLGERGPLGIQVLRAGIEGAAAVADDHVADAWRA
jgi:hypothetical protein